MRYLQRQNTHPHTNERILAVHQMHPLPHQSRWRSPSKPHTLLETLANTMAHAYLEQARLYATAKDTPNAVSCCLEGLAATYGIPRPLAVRDQLQDLLGSLDATQEIQVRIGAHPNSAAQLHRNRSADFAHATRSPTHLERLVSVHQLLDYPSDLPSFNRAYVEAITLQETQPVQEFYLVQYTGPFRRQADHLGNLHLAVVQAAQISATGPFYLTDICAVVRR